MSKALATKNVAAVLVAAALVLGFAFSFATPAKADTLSDLQAQVQALLAQIASLQGGSSSTVSSGACHTFTQNLKSGSTGSEVKSVQQFLNSMSDTKVASSGAGSPGNETSTFGPATKAAVIKFQQKYAADILTPVGLTAGNGNWFASTRAKANALCAGSSTTTGGTTTGGTTIPTGPGITVSAAAQPANSLAPQNSSRVPFTTFTLTNNTGSAVTINGVTVQRAGLAQDAAFSGVVLLDNNGLQVGIAHTFNSNHQTNVGDTFTLAPGQSTTYTVAGNMAASLSSYAGQIASISVVGINTTVPVSGSLPITGAQQTLNSTLTIGAVSTTTSSFDPGAAQSKNIGDTAVRFSGIRFTANSSEDLKLYSIRWRQVGTASASDFSNVVTVANGTSYPTTIDSSGKYYTVVFPGGILIPKGNSIDVYVQGDITGSNAASRTIEMDIDKVTDVYFVGQLYGYGISPSGTYTPWFNQTNEKTTINAGSATAIQNDTTVPAANVAININNTLLGGFTTNFVGEPVTVTGITIHAATSSGAGSGLLTSVSIVDQNGAVVAGPKDATYNSSTGNQDIAFTDSVTFATGVHSYKIKGKVPSLSNGGVITLSTTPSSDWTSPTGQTSGNTISLPTGGVTMSQMTVRTAQVVITASPYPPARTIIAGSNAVELADIIFDAGQSGEDVRMSSMPLFYTNAAGSASDINTCQLYNGSVALNANGSNVISPTAAGNTIFTFDNPFTVLKGTQVTLVLKCNVKSGATGQYQWGVNSGNKPTVTGVQSGNTVAAAQVSVTTGNSGNQTAAGSGTLTFTVDPSSPSFTLAAGGTAAQTMGVYKLRATNGPVTVTDLGLTLTNSATTSKATADGNASNAATDFTSFKLCTDAACTQQVGSLSFVNSSTGNMTATSTLSTPITVNPGTDVLVYAVASLANVGASQVGGIGDTLKVDPLNAKGTSGSSAVNIAGSGTTAGVQLFRSFPSLAAGPAAPVNPNGTNAIVKEFSITANNSGNGVAIYQLPFSVSTSSAQASVFKLYAFTGNDYATGPVSGIGTGGQFGVSTGTTYVSQCASGCTTSSPTLTFYAASSSPLYIPAGATRYFKLTATVNPNSGVTNWNVNVTLLGTSSALGSLTSGYQVATSTAPGFGTSDFVWSDVASTSAVSADPDWTNGNNVPGLSASGL